MSVEFHERRFKASDPDLKPGSRLCRLCFRIVDLEPGHIETTPMYVYVRCPHCENSFPIRHSDIETVPGCQAPVSETG
jgi:hypothetical protein